MRRFLDLVRRYHDGVNAAHGVDWCLEVIDPGYRAELNGQLIVGRDDGLVPCCAGASPVPEPHADGP